MKSFLVEFHINETRDFNELKYFYEIAYIILSIILIVEYTFHHHTIQTVTN